MLTDSSDKNYKDQIYFAFAAVSDLVAIMVLPILFFILFGKYLGAKFGHQLVYLFISGAVGILVGMVGVYQKAKEL